MTKKHQANIKTFSQIEIEWQNIQTLDIKNKLKAMKQIAFDIYNVYKLNEINAQHLKFYIDVLNQIHRVHDLPRSKLALSKMIRHWLELTGNANVNIIKKINGKINVEAASIAVTDSYYVKDVLSLYSKYTEREIVNAVNDSKMFIWNTGFDGIFNVQIRWVESIEPVLSAKEYKCVVASTETAIINFPEGRVFVSDPFHVDVVDERLSMQVDPGYYKINVFHFYIKSKIDSFYIVLAKTTTDAKNQLTKLTDLT